MEKNAELTAEYKGKKYQRPDGKVIVISHVESHVLSQPFEDGSTLYSEVLFEVIDAEEGSPGWGKCTFGSLKSLPEVE